MATVMVCDRCRRRFLFDRPGALLDGIRHSLDCLGRIWTVPT